MSAPALIEIFCDGNKKIGMGHIRRSSALAEKLKEAKIDVIISGLSEEAKKLLPAQPSYNRKPDVVLFDSLEGIDNELQKAQSNKQLTITLDWFGDTIPDINIVVFPHSEVRAKKEKYIGFEYIILREEILRAERPVVTDNNKVLICLGGADLLKQSYDAAVLLKEQGFDITLVQGPLAKNIPDDGIRKLVDPSDFPSLLANCDWAVTNGAGCFFEAMYLGKAAFVLPQTGLEMRIAVFAQKENAVLGIGMDQLRGFSYAEIKETSAKGAALVNGGGLDRVTAIIKNLL